MAGNASRHARRITWRSALPSFATSVLLFIAALNPASLAAAPNAAAPKDVARKDTLIVSGFGPGLTEIQDPTNMNPYSLGGLGRVRDILNKTIFEFLYLYNHNTGEEIPWLATSYTIAPDAKSVDVTLRSGIEWSDGQPFTADDVKFTLEMLRHIPALVFAADINEGVRDVTSSHAAQFAIRRKKPTRSSFCFSFV